VKLQRKEQHRSQWSFYVILNGHQCRELGNGKSRPVGRLSPTS